MTIRPPTRPDVAPALDVVVAAGMFARDDVGVVADLLDGYFRAFADEHVCLVAGRSGSVEAVAYAQPAPAADRVWYLTMIGVHPHRQRSGIGGALLEAVENRLVDDGQRLLLVETSALPAYTSARRFYVKAGYREEARVRDFHEDGDDMVLFRKRLSGNDSPEAP